VREGIRGDRERRRGSEIEMRELDKYIDRKIGG
jgi:hypothetical protein